MAESQARVPVGAVEFVDAAIRSPEVYVGVLAILITILLPAIQRSRKNLFFDVVAECELSDPANRTLFVIDVRNAAGRILGWLAGGMDIPKSHYERPLSFHFGANARLRGAGVVEEHPDGIGARVSISPVRRNKLLLDPVLLNEGDTIRIRAEVENQIDPLGSHRLERDAARYDLIADGRIMGVRQIEKKRTTSAWSGTFVVLTIFAGFLILPAALLARLVGPSREMWVAVPYLILNATSVILASLLLAVIVAREVESTRITKRMRSLYDVSERVSGVKRALEGISYKKHSDPARQAATRFILAGLLWLIPVLVDLFQFVPLPLAPFAILGEAFETLDSLNTIVALLLVAMGLERLDALQRGSLGPYGHFGFYVVTAAIATEMVLYATVPSGIFAFSLFSVYSLSGLTEAFGFIVYGAATLRADILPRWYGVLLILFAVGSWLPYLPYPLNAALPALILLALGDSMWSRKSRTTT